MKLNIFKILNKTTAEGPGKRFCLWVQGCSRHCRGCHAKSTWSHNINKLMDVDEVFNLIKSQTLLNRRRRFLFLHKKLKKQGFLL